MVNKRLPAGNGGARCTGGQLEGTITGPKVPPTTPRRSQRSRGFNARLGEARTRVDSPLVLTWTCASTNSAPTTRGRQRRPSLGPVSRLATSFARLGREVSRTNSRAWDTAFHCRCSCGQAPRWLGSRRHRGLELSFARIIGHSCTFLCPPSRDDRRMVRGRSSRCSRRRGREAV